MHVWISRIYFHVLGAVARSHHIGAHGRSMMMIRSHLRTREIHMVSSRGSGPPGEVGMRVERWWATQCPPHTHFIPKSPRSARTESGPRGHARAIGQALFFSRYFFFPEGPNRTQESVREVFWRPCNLPCHRRGLIGEPTKMYSAVFLVPIYSPQLLLSRRLVRSISYSIISLMKEAAVQIGTEGKCE